MPISYETRPTYLSLLKVYPPQDAAKLVKSIAAPPMYISRIEPRTPQQIRDEKLKDAYERGYNNLLAEEEHNGNVKDGDEILKSKWRRLKQLKKSSTSVEDAYKAEEAFQREAGSIARDIRISRVTLDKQKQFNVPFALYTREMHDEDANLSGQAQERIEAAENAKFQYEKDIHDYDLRTQDRRYEMDDFKAKHIPIRERFSLTKKELQKMKQTEAQQYSTKEDLKGRHQRAELHTNPLKLDASPSKLDTNPFKLALRHLTKLK